MGWQFEVAKMFMYVSFPVAIFHYFNQPANFEEWVIQTKKDHFPPQSKEAFEQMNKFIYDYNAKVENNHWKEMEKQLENKP